MTVTTCTTGRSKGGVFAVARFMVAAGVLSVAGAGAASAYIGESFLQVPGVAGGWKGEKYADWVALNANYWKSMPLGVFSVLGSRRGKGDRTAGGGMGGSNLYFSGPAGPSSGASALVVSMDKRNPALPKLMELCAGKAKFPEMTYAESAELTRPSRELGSRPAEIPEYYEYKLKDAQVTDCPVVADAPDQAFVVSFNDIEMLNYKSDGGKETTAEPAVLPPLKTTGKTKTFLLTWFYEANYVSDDQCPVVNTKPTEADYYALVPKEEAAKERAALVSKGGVNYENEQMALRGPDRLNVCQLPGIVRDQANAEPQTKVARGLNLDGDDGNGGPPAGTCKHANFISEDGRTGIDNQLFRVRGCIQGAMGHKGMLGQFQNEELRNGKLNLLFVITGIDDEKKDGDVDVTIVFSEDRMAKNAAGNKILPNFTFALSDKPEHTQFMARLKGRIENGVITTEPVKKLQFSLGLLAGRLNLYDASIRMELQPDGNMKGIIGGYVDWRTEMTGMGLSRTESNHGYKCPAVYNAFRRYADGLKDPVTGECNGISSAYDIEGVPAYIPPEEFKALLAGVESRGPERLAKTESRAQER